MLRTVRGGIRCLSWGLAVSAAAVAAVAEEPLGGLFRLPDDPPSAASQQSGIAALETDLVKERYPNGQLKIERTVALDEHDNYVNHGPWTMWDEQGRLLGGGQFRQGEREGRWVRHYQQDDQADVLASPLVRKFQPPFTAEANFVGGKLHGAWVMLDSKKRIVFAWMYENGRRHGKSVWCFPNGQPAREANYADGLLDGEVLELGPDQGLVQKETYRQGRQLTTKVEYHAPNLKKLEAVVLLARDAEGTIDDFWNGTSLPVAPAGPAAADQRHGLCTLWHRNGQVAVQGVYEFDRPEGVFTWWHPNGQKAIEGNFSQGKPSGVWTWWHDNGLKEMRGTFLMGLQAGKWNRWAADGKLVEAQTFPEAGAPDTGLATAGQSIEPKPQVVPATVKDAAPGVLPPVQAARSLKRR